MVHLHRRSSSTLSPSSSPLTDEKITTARHRRHSLRNISSTISGFMKTTNSTSSSSESSSTASSVLEDTKHKLVSRRTSITKATLARMSDASRLTKLLNKKSHGEPSEKLKRRSWSGALQGIKRRNSPPSLEQYQPQGLLPPPPPPAAAAAAAVIPPPEPASRCAPSTIAEEQDYHPCDTVVKEPSQLSNSDEEDRSEASININSKEEEEEEVEEEEVEEEQQPAVAEESASSTIPTNAWANESISVKSLSLSSSSVPVGSSSPVFDTAAALLRAQLGRTSALELESITQNSRIEAALVQLGSPSLADAPTGPGTAIPLYFGATVGTTAAHAHRDQEGNKSTIVTGYCVVTEPERVPKSLILDDDYDQVMLVRRVTNNNTLMRIRYICLVGLEEATTKFARRPSSQWVPDHQVQACQHTSCPNVFGFFMRRHHCRSCGHIFCYKHSANQLALFDSHDDAYSNSRVCDGCLYHLLQ